MGNTEINDMVNDILNEILERIEVEQHNEEDLEYYWEENNLTEEEYNNLVFGWKNGLEKARLIVAEYKK